MTVITPLTGQVTTTVLVNVRQGAPSTSAPIARKLAAGTVVTVTGLAIGQPVAQNPHWYVIGGDGYVWAGGCSPVTPVGASSDSGVVSPLPQSDPRLAGFGLEPAFAAKLSQLLDACAGQNLDFRIVQGLRSPQTQARYYCEWAQRTAEMIQADADTLQAAGAPWTAALMQSLADITRIPNWQTSQLPGSGWHQWGEAADCYCYRDGVMVSSGSDPCYKQYADLARTIGLTPGFYFSKPDPGHVQLRAAAGATSLYTWAEIDETMKSRFGDKPQLAA